MTTLLPPPHKDPSLIWLLVISMAMHGAVFVLFSGLIFSRPRIESRPVYYVDLSRMPVLNPQAGRPDGGPAPQAKPAAKPKPPAPAPAPTPAPAPKPEPGPKPAPAPKPEPAPAPAAKPKPASVAATSTRPASTKATAEPAKPAAPAATGQGSYQSVQEKLAVMRARQQKEQEITALKSKIAALSKEEGSGSGAPLGMPTGTGDEVGVDQQTWLRAFYKENWSLSKYQVTRLDLEATVSITYNSEGHLVNYRFVKPSGNATFDDSLKKAILKDRILPFKPGRTLHLEVVFNLKDLME